MGIGLDFGLGSGLGQISVAVKLRVGGQGCMCRADNKER